MLIADFLKRETSILRPKEFGPPFWKFFSSLVCLQNWYNQLLKDYLMEFLSMKLVVQTSFGLEFDIVPSGVHVILESFCILVLSGKFY